MTPITAEKISVIIPVLNRSTLLLRTLRSVAEQSYRPLEIIVVDNGSDDGSYETALEFASSTAGSAGLSVKVYRHSDPGASKARNYGFGRATGDVTLFFDSDDIMLPGALQAYMEGFRRHPWADIVLSRTETKHHDGRIRTNRHRKGDRLTNHFHHCTLHTQGFAARRGFLSRVEAIHGSLWPEQLGVWDDWALGIRILLAGPQTALISGIACRVLPQKQSITGEAYCTTGTERYMAALADVEATASLHRRLKPRLTKEQFRHIHNLILYRKAMLSALLHRESRRLPDDVIERSPYPDRGALARESRRILDDAIAEAPTRRVRRVLRAAHFYIRSGLRGCAFWTTPLL